VGEIGGPGENHRPVASHRQTLSHNVVVQKMCFDGQLQYTRYMHNLNNLLSPILALGGVEHNVVLCKTGSVSRIS
jgi:hypothetical protein